jgi:hypothetical protein
MNRYQTFIFKSYQFDEPSKTLRLYYSYDEQLSFSETFKFSFDFANYSPEVLDRAIQSLFFMAGVSYYKAYLPQEIKLESGQLDKLEADFFSKTYQKGLAELFYVNDLDPEMPVLFPVNSEKNEPVLSSGEGFLIGIGGGKDSLVSTELLRNLPNVSTWSVGHDPNILKPLADLIGLTHYDVERKIDPKLYDLNKQDNVYNGHIPLSAILACLGTVVAVLSGRRDVVVSNESSANEPNLTYQGVKINHQYSKSLEFEQDFQAYLSHNFGESIRYYSFLRPLTELRIAEIFSKNGFEKYKAVFSSCNKAFRHTSTHIFWCGECPKCAFAFLAFTPFIDRAKLEALWRGKNLLLDLSLEPTYRQLLGIEGNKPLDCVGEIKEARSAMELAKNIYPDLEKYQYEIPENYDYKQISPHSMPPDIYSILQKAIV